MKYQNSQLNGSLMRCTPIAVYSHLLSAEDLHKVVVADVSFTHCHQNVISSVYLYCYAIGRLIKYAGNADRATLAFEQTFNLCKKNCTVEVMQWLELSVSFDKAGKWDIEVLDPSKSMGFLKHAFVLAFLFLRKMPHLSYEQCVS